MTTDRAMPAQSQIDSAHWRKSSFSGDQGNCVEVTRLSDGRIVFRNSNHRDDGTVLFTPAELSDWVNGCKAGEFDDLT